jgi:catechol 2,3-dioxygenase-like lactoylglutathione lyase family enzyme
MSIVLDHTIVPAKDKVQSARFLADLLGLPVNEHCGPFAAVQVNQTLTLDFDTADEFESHHLAFLVSTEVFDSALDKIKAGTITFGSGPHAGFDGQTYLHDDREGFYFSDPNGHIYELITPR